MTDSGMDASLLLGVIALATLVMAIVQVAAAVYVARLGRKVGDLTKQVEQDVGPVATRLAEMTGDAAKAASLAVAQMERIDRLTADLAARLDATMNELQRAIVWPLREGLAVMAGLRAGLDALGGSRRRGNPAERRPADEDEALFIG
jgi:hypothetical protein